MMKKYIEDLLLFTAGVPRDEEQPPEALPGIYVIAASVILVAFLVSIGSGLLAARSLPEAWLAFVRWPVIIIIAGIAGGSIYFVDHSLIIAGEGISNSYINLTLFIMRIFFVVIFSSNFAHELVIWRHEESLNLTRLSLEQEQLRKNQTDIEKLYDLPVLREAQNTTSSQIAELRNKRERLPNDINEKFAMANKAKSNASALWRQWTVLKDTAGDSDVLERLRQRAIKKSDEAKRIGNMARREKNDYLQRIDALIDEQSGFLGDTQKKLSVAGEKASKMVEPRREAIKMNYSARSVNRAALDKLRKENPEINTEIYSMIFFFCFLEIFPVLLKLIIGSSNPIFKKINHKLITEASYYRSLTWMENAREKAFSEALCTPEMRTSLREHAIMQINSRLPFSKYNDIIEDSIRYGRRYRRNGLTPDSCEMYFKAAGEAYRKAGDDYKKGGDNGNGRKH
jgi:hypothetical protein